MPKKLTAYLYDKNLDFGKFDIYDLACELYGGYWGETTEEAYKNTYNKSHDEDAMYKIEVTITKMTPAEVQGCTKKRKRKAISYV